MIKLLFFLIHIHPNHIKKVPAIVKEMSDDEAIIKMVDANIQREEILPSERAFSFMY